MTRELARRCEIHLRSVRLPERIDTIEQVAEHLSAVRSRPLHLSPYPMSSTGISGAWLPTADADYVFYEHETSARHQVQIIAHELGHMICGHTAASHGSLGDLIRLAPGAAAIMLSRDRYSDIQEREAEQLADLLVGRLDDVTGPKARDPLQAALEHRPSD